jgi:hypothetical protein
LNMEKKSTVASVLDALDSRHELSKSAENLSPSNPALSQSPTC